MRLHLLGSLALLAAVLACEPGLRPHHPAAVPQSSTVMTSEDGQTLLAVDADHNAERIEGLREVEAEMAAAGRADHQRADGEAVRPQAVDHRMVGRG